MKYLLRRKTINQRVILATHCIQFLKKLTVPTTQLPTTYLYDSVHNIIHRTTQLYLNIIRIKAACTTQLKYIRDIEPTSKSSTHKKVNVEPCPGIPFVYRVEARRGEAPHRTTPLYQKVNINGCQFRRRPRFSFYVTRIFPLAPFTREQGWRCASGSGLRSIFTHDNFSTSPNTAPFFKQVKFVDQRPCHANHTPPTWAFNYTYLYLYTKRCDVESLPVCSALPAAARFFDYFSHVRYLLPCHDDEVRYAVQMENLTNLGASKSKMFTLETNEDTMKTFFSGVLYRPADSIIPQTDTLYVYK